MHAALAFLLVFGLSGCKPTDFFIDKIIAPQAEQVDENNPDKILVNSPDAQQESSALAALDWTEDSPKTENVQSLVTWSSDPNSILSTHHSVFDLSARFPGILASDGVALAFNADSSLQGEVDPDQDTQRDDVSPSGAANSSRQSDEPTTQGVEATQMTTEGISDSEDSATGNQAAGDSKGDGGPSSDDGSESDGDADGGDSDGEDDGGGVSPDPGTDPGRTPDYSGYNGEVPLVKTNELLTEIPQADSVGVIGKQAAVAVQAIGGKGAISAMSAFDYAYKDLNSTSSFSDVFASNANEWDASSVYLWDAGSSSSETVDLSTIDAAKLVEACGFDGVVFYDQDLVPDINSALPEDVKREAYGYNIRFLNLSFSSVRNMSDSAYAIGQVLSESTSIGQASSVANASAYMDTLESIQTSFRNLLRDTVYLNVVTDAQTATPTTSRGASLATQLVLFSDYGQDDYKPLNTWLSCAGVTPSTVGYSVENSTGKGNLSFLCPVDGTFTLNGTGNALSRWKAAGYVVNRMTETTGTAGVISGNKGGLGSADSPYLVCAGSSDGSMSNTDVRDQVRSSIGSYVSGWGVTIYSAFPYKGTNFDIPSGSGFTNTSIGLGGGGGRTNPLTEIQTINTTVRANPNGVLGSWTDVSFESCLETVWIADLFSQPVESSGYNPSVDWDSFSCVVGDTTVSGKGKTASEVAEEIISAFYDKFYRGAYTLPDLDG